MRSGEAEKTKNPEGLERALGDFVVLAGIEPATFPV